MLTTTAQCQPANAVLATPTTKPVLIPVVVVTPPD